MSRNRNLFKCHRATGISLVKLILAGATLLSSSSAQAPQSNGGSTSNHAPAPSSATHPHSRYAPNHLSKKADDFYAVVWGVDSLSVRAVESGSLIRFSYRVVDPKKAAIFNNKNIEAFLDSPAYRIRLVIPSLEKVGQLRQVNTPEVNHSYWMAFSNPRHTVKPGDRVNVVIGTFRADGLVIQ